MTLVTQLTLVRWFSRFNQEMRIDRWEKPRGSVNGVTPSPLRTGQRLATGSVHVAYGAFSLPARGLDACLLHVIGGDGYDN
jgi:hypothetical protein